MSLTDLLEVGSRPPPLAGYVLVARDYSGLEDQRVGRYY